MKKLKMMLILALLAVMAASVWAGGNRDSGSSSSSSSGSTSSTSSAQPVTLRFSWWGTTPRHEATLAVIAAFEAKNPNIKIEAEYGNQDGYNDKKTTEFASRTAPDVFQIETGAGPEYQKLGVLYNLSTLPIDLTRFNPGFLASIGQYGTGQQWTLPTAIGGTAVTVNKTLQDRIGGIDFSKPYDWEQLITWGQRVRSVDPTCYLLSINSREGTAFFVRARVRQMTGGSGIDDAAKRLVVTEAQLTEIYNFISRLYTTGTAAPAASKAAFGFQDWTDPAWIAGKYVATIGFLSTMDNLAAANTGAQYIAGQLPLAANRVNDGWFNDTNQKMGIYAYTKYPQEAAKFLDFFYSDEAARILGTVRGGPLPTISGAQINAQLNQISPLLGLGSAVSNQYNGKTDAGLFTATEASTILETAYEEVAYGRMTGAQAARQVVTQLNDYLSRQ